MRITTLLVSGAISVFAFQPAHAQELDVSEPSKWPSITLGGGVLPYFGELQQNYDITALNHARTGLYAAITKRFGNYFSIGLSGLYGKVSHHESSLFGNKNFESKLTGGGVDVLLHFDNDLLINRGSLFAPYLKFGGAFFSFDPHGDLLDKSGNQYHYWSDGSIRNSQETDTTHFTSTTIHRDYKYETQLKDSNNYQRNTLAIPIGVGAAFRFSRSFEGNIGATYYLTQTDYLDNISADGKNDKFMFVHAGITWNMGYKSPAKAAEGRYKDVNFSALEKMDSDGDGVNDVNDNCQNTPAGVKVNGKGCPLDDDNDGVPDYRDKELNTPRGALVDESGMTLTDERLAARALRYDSLATERKNVFSQNPSLATLQQIDQERTERSGVAIPDELKEADLNNDGYISPDEITKTIDMFFEGETNFTALKIERLIDFFFEQ